jgi:hypothetical protein
MEKIHLQDENGYYCAINNTYYPTLRGLLNYLRIVPITAEDYYLKYLGEAGKCKTCKSPTRFNSLRLGYKQYCCSNCSVKNENHKKAVKERFVNDRDKLLKSLEKRNATMASKSDKEILDIARKRVSSLKRNYGDDYFSQKAKRQWERRTQQDVKDLVSKSVATRIKNGSYIDAPYKNANKSIIISGREFKVQGYEDIALNLLAEIVDISSIKIGKDVPRITLPNNRKYYPDIMIDNLIIEVKSEYTFNIRYQENIIKNKYTILSGYNHIFLVIHSKDINKDRTLKDKQKYLNILHKAISSQASSILEEGSTTIP